MITSRIVALAAVFCFAEVTAFFFTAFFAMDQTLEMFLKYLSSIWRKCIEYLANLIDSSLLLFGQVEFFAIRMLRTIFPAALVVSSFSDSETKSAPALSSRSLI